MKTHVLRGIVLFSAAMSTGCFGAMNPPPPGYLAEPDSLTMTVEAQPADVIAAAAGVLSDWGFGIATVNERVGIVQSAEKTVQGGWRDAAAKDYLYCGKAWDSGVEHALSNPITFTVGVNARADDAGSTIVRINVNGSVYKKGFGAVQPETYPCQPTSQFAREFLADLNELLKE